MPRPYALAIVVNNGTSVTAHPLKLGHHKKPLVWLSYSSGETGRIINASKAVGAGASPWTAGLAGTCPLLAAEPAIRNNAKADKTAMQVNRLEQASTGILNHTFLSEQGADP
jgi:hypothetical protein